RCPKAARAAERLMAVVVLPTPPFWLEMARIVAMAMSSGVVGVVGGRRRRETREGGRWENRITPDPRSALRRAQENRRIHGDPRIEKQLQRCLFDQRLPDFRGRSTWNTAQPAAPGARRARRLPPRPWPTCARCTAEGCPRCGTP